MAKVRNSEGGGDAQLSEGGLEGVGVGDEGVDPRTVAQGQEPDPHGETGQHGRSAELRGHSQTEEGSGQYCVAPPAPFGEAHHEEEGEAAEEGEHRLRGVEVGQLDVEDCEGGEKGGE